MLDSLLFDLRFAFRSLQRRPGFLILATLTLALGIGANTAIFTVFRGVVLRPLPLPEAERLVRFESNQSPPNLVDLGERQDSVAAAGYALWGFDLVPSGDAARPARIDGAMITEGFFRVLGVSAARGRLFAGDDHREQAARAAVVSHGFWQRHLGGDPAALGAELHLSGRPATVVGVLPPSFRFPEASVDIWMPLAVEYPVALPARNAHFLRALGRVAPGIPVSAARADLERVAGTLEADYPEPNGHLSLSFVPWGEHLTGGVRRPLLLLTAAVGVVLLIAWVNVATLVLSRASRRGRELAVRSACGADRRRLLRQLLVESLLLGAVGGAAGLLLASWTVDGLVALAGTELPRPEAVRLDFAVVVFTALVALATSVAASLLPAWSSARGDLLKPLRTAGAASPGRSGSRLRRVLVVGQVAAAVVLLIGAGLLLKSFAQVLAVDPGFQTPGVQTLRLDLPEARYGAIEEQVTFLERTLAELERAPGLQSAGLVSELPMDSGRISHTLEAEGRQTEGDEDLRAWAREVSGGYFETLGIELLRGRVFDDRDRAGAPAVAVINQSLADFLWPDEAALGRRLRWVGGGEDFPWMTVVGVVADVRHLELERREGGAVYTSFRQKPMEWKRWTSVVVSSPLAEVQAAEAMAVAVGRVDPSLPVTRERSLESWVQERLAGRRFSLVLLGLFAFLAVTLSATGIYGLLSFTVAARRREIGIRIALGARPRGVMASFLGQTAALATLALGLGLPAAVLGARWLASMLYQVSTLDPTVYLTVAALVVTVALAAAWLPARRALGIDPVVALREE